ncbi:hypothetical protein GEMRC1_013681 [Eukaryota sp. GEM-RC1]
MTSSLTYSSFDVPLDTMTVCNGNLTFRNGSQYSGEILNGLPYGEGILTFISGTTVSGTFFKGQSTSATTITFPNESVFTGDTLNSLPHGHGSYLGYSGSFHQGKRHGKGIYISDEVDHDGKWKFKRQPTNNTIPTIVLVIKRCSCNRDSNKFIFLMEKSVIVSEFYQVSLCSQ